MYLKEKILESLKLLSQERPIFHSEDDFKFAFSNTLQKIVGKGCEIRLERPVDIEMVCRDGVIKPVKAPMDIVLLYKNSMYPIELKYKTKALQIIYGEEEYNLAKQEARDKGRFSFRKDIYRLEYVVQKNNKKSNDNDKKYNDVQGFFIVITNDEKYLDNISSGNTLDKNYSFHDNASLHKKDLGWNYEKLEENGKAFNPEEHETSRGESFYQLNLKNEYAIKWEEYSEVGANKKNLKFYFSVSEVNN
jgi:hypothetical protein